MNKIDYLTTESYDAGDDFVVDIVTNNQADLREVWLHHKEYGIKMFVYGFAEGQDWTLEVTEKTINDFKKVYIDKYIDEVM